MPDHVPPHVPLPPAGSHPGAGADVRPDHPDGTDLLAVLTAALVPVRDAAALDAALSHLVLGAARLVPEVGHAAVVVEDGERWVTRCSTDDVARDVVSAELAAGAGPAYEAVEQRATVHAAWRRLDGGEPAHAALATRHGLRAEVCVPLLDHRRVRGLLVGLCPEVALAVSSRRLLETLAAAATGAVERFAHQQDVARALETRSVIGQAIGIVRERYGLEHERAWDYLVRLASSRETKLAVVARELVDGGVGEGVGVDGHGDRDGLPDGDPDEAPAEG